MAELPTDPIRREHRELARHLEHLDTASARVTSMDADSAARLLPRLVSFLSGDLMSHARTEEEVLYPVVDRIAGAGVTATMVADHVGIAERVETLANSVDKALGDWDDRDVVADVSRQLAAISAIVGLHFRKEEDVLLPILDGGLSVEEGHALLEAAGHGHEEHHHD